MNTTSHSSRIQTVTTAAYLALGVGVRNPTEGVGEDSEVGGKAIHKKVEEKTLH